MKKNLVFISTHIINEAVISEYKKMAKGKNYDYVLAIDNENFKTEIDNRISEKEFFGTKVKCFFFDKKLNEELKLPKYERNNLSEDFGKIMWYNGEYRFFYVKKYFPDYDFYWQLDWDCYFNGESYDAFLDQYLDRNEDLLILDFRKEILNGNWYHSKYVEWLYKDKEIYGSLYCISRISGRAADFLYDAIFKIEEKYKNLDDKSKSFWPFCELVTPTELMNNGYTCADIHQDTITYNKEYDLNTNRLFEHPDNLFYHPIKGDFINRENTLKKENQELKRKIKRLRIQNKTLNKKIEKLSTFKFNLFGIKFSHRKT